MSWLFTSDDQNTGASVSASDLPMSIQGSFPLRLTSLVFLLSKGPQECSPAPQFEGVHSLMLCFLYGPALTTIHGHWEHHIRTFVGRVMSLLFSTLSLSSFSCQEQSSSDFMAAVTTCSNFGAQEEEIFLYFHFFPFYLPCSNGAGCHDLSFF